MIVDVIIVALALGFSVWVIYTILSLAPWFPTRRMDIVRIGRLAHLTKGHTFCDLGSGDGRVVISLAELYPENFFVGIEMSFFFYALARVRLFFSDVSNVQLVRGNIYTQKYSDVDVVYIFGTARTLNGAFYKRIIPLLRPGTKILSYNFHFTVWNGAQYKDQPIGHAPIYVYDV